MKNRNRNALLIEILIAVFFFALCSTVLLNLFYAVHNEAKEAEYKTEALIRMQDLAECLYAEADAEAYLEEQSFQPENGEWVKALDGYYLAATVGYEPAEAGVLRSVKLLARTENQTLGELVSARYYPKEAVR